MRNKKTNAGGDSALTFNAVEALSSDDQQRCEQIEGWIARIQNGETHGFETTDRLEQIAASLWSIGQHTSGSVDAGNDDGIDDATRPIIDGYQITAKIGRGGMGMVYRARDLQLKRTVALKVLPVDRLSSERAKKRFRIEVQAAAQLEHPAIVPVYECGESSDGLYYSMREIDGIDLSKKIQSAQTTQSGDQDPSCFGPAVAPHSPEYQKWVARIGKAVAEALAHSHDQLVIHRDVKPANILIDRNGDPFLSDFGLARISEGSDLTADNDLLGTLRYMSPEQIEGGPQPVDARSDVYSLGITLYELLTGQPAIEETNLAPAWKQVKEGRIVAPSQINSRLERDLETIVLKAIAPEPEQRYQTAQAFADDLDRFLNVMPIQASRATIGLKLNRWVKRNRNWVITLGLVASSLLAVIFASAIYNAYRSGRDAETIRRRSAQLLDAAGVEKLFRGDALRAREDFRQAAQLTSSADDQHRQQLRIAAIDSLSPKLVKQRGYRGFLLAHHRSGIDLVSVRDHSMASCFLEQNGHQPIKILETMRRIELAAISPDGNWCAIVIGDRTNQYPELKIYDVKNQKLSTVAEDIQWRITHAWFLPDNQSLVTTGWGGSVQLWDAATSKLVRSKALAKISPNLPWVFTARTDAKKTVMVAAVNPGRIVAHWLPDLDPVWAQPTEISTWRADAFAVSPNAKWIAAGTADEGIRIWELRSQRELKMGNNVIGKPTVASFSPDSQLLAAGDNRGNVYVWRMPTNQDEFVSRPGIVMHHDYSITSLRFNGRSQLLVGAGDSARVWRLADNQPLTSLLPIDARVRSVDWTENQEIRVNLREKSKDRQQIWRIPEHFSSDNADRGSLLKILSAATTANHENEFDVVATIDSTDRKLPDRRESNIGSTTINAIRIPSNTLRFAVSDDGRRITTIQPTGDSYMLRTFDIHRTEPIGEPIETKVYPEHLDLNENGSRWITGGFDGRINVGDVETGLNFQIKLPNWSLDACFLSGGQFASTCWDGKLRIWDLQGEKIGEFDHSSLPDLLVARDDVLIVASGRTISTYRRENRTDWSRTSEVDHQSGTIQHVAISPASDRWLSCGDNGTNIVWSIAGNQIAELPVIGPVTIGRFSRDGRWLATLSESGAINLWESKTGKPMGPAIHGQTRIRLLEWSDYRLIFGGNGQPGYWLADLTLPDNWSD